MAILGSILKKAIELRGKVPPTRKTALKKQLSTLRSLMKKAEFTAFGEHYKFGQKIRSAIFITRLGKIFQHTITIVCLKTGGIVV